MFGRSNLSASTKVPRRSYLLSEATQHGNLGDVALNVVLLEALCARGPVITLKSQAPLPRLYLRSLERSGVARLSGPAFVAEALRRRLRGETLVICLNPGGQRGRYLPALTVRIAILALARLLGIRLVRLGVSLGPFSRWRRLQERCLAALLDVQAVRDTRSLAMIGDRANGSARTIPDLTLLCKDVLAPPSDGRERRRIALSLRPGHCADPARHHAMLRRVGEMVSRICRDCRLELVVVAQVTSDIPTLQELATHYGAEFVVIDADDPCLEDRLAVAYGSTALIITNRLHAGLFAALNGAVPLFLVEPEHDTKIVAMIEDAGLVDLLVTEERLAWLASRAETLLRDAGHHRTRLARYLAKASEELRVSFDHVLGPPSAAADTGLDQPLLGRRPVGERDGRAPVMSRP